MKKYNLSRDEFAKFMFKIGMNCSNYNYDIVRDLISFNCIEKLEINKAKNEFEDYPTKEKVQTEIFLFVRDLGTHIWSTNTEIGLFSENSVFDQLKNDCDKFYKLTFCWNCDYFSYKEFCQVEEQIKN